jgi:all-trans-8'-apo-beta-carotenal 15,15'-oxygenase
MRAAKLFKDRYKNFEQVPLRIEGDLPSDISGRLFRVGVGQFSKFGERHRHWFDGDAGIVKIEIKDQQAVGSLRILDCSPPDEAKAGRMILGRYGRAPQGLWRRLKSILSNDMFVNSANTSLIPIGEKVFALWEGGLPTEIDTQSLERLGESDFEKTLSRSFSAHPKWHAPSGELVNFGIRYFPKPIIDLYSVSMSCRARRLAHIPFSGGSFIHDFAVTARYAIFMVAPVFMSAGDFLVRGRSISESMQWRPKQKTEVIVVDLRNPDKIYRMHTNAVLVTHVINAFEVGESKISVDAITYADISDINRTSEVLDGRLSPEGSRGKPVRWHIDLISGTVDLEMLTDWSAETPTVISLGAGGETETFAAVGYRNRESEKNELFDSIGIFNCSTRELKTIDFSGDTICEANLVVSQAKGKHLLVQAYSSERDQSYVAVLSVEARPERVATLWMPSALPFTFHGYWEARVS